ncbi:MAG: SGNH/GDSL hydrolase family protein [Spirochaetales bacterium]|nr:SGNH/GDSL hydrolase family protein [Spirochaetales bacterium]
MKKASVFLIIILIVSGALFAQDIHWVTTWGNAPQRTEKSNMPPAPGLSGSTLRQKLRVSIGGETIRVQFSNAFGNGPVKIEAATIAETDNQSKIKTETLRTINFGGKKGITIPQDEAVWSDPLVFHVAPLAELTVSIYFSEVPDGLTGHPGSRTTSYMVRGNHVEDEIFTASLKPIHWYILTRIDVQADRKSKAIAILGDSLTDGRGSWNNKNNRWPDNLAARLQSSDEYKHISVVNMGIGGNSLCTGGIGPLGVQRLDRDVFDVAGIRWLIVMIGVNDIGGSGGEMNVTKTPARMISAYQEIISKAKAHGIKVYAIPIFPFGGSGYDNEWNRKIREAVNNWMYTSGEFDAIIPLDKVVCDPNDPQILLKEFDDSDHLHLKPAGYQKMADEIDLALFRE